MRNSTEIISLHIADFGVSKIFNTNAIYQASTTTGTMDYMPPEMVDSSKKYDSFLADGK